ncbi:MAG: hypothetical protein WA081_08550 [Desulfosalsimonadaceae bacterium]
MILSRNDFISYCNADKAGLGRKRIFKAFFNDIDRFQKVLRRMEYNKNCKKNILIQFVTILRFRQLSAKLGFTIPINVFGPGLIIMHRGTIIVTPNARVGANCKINADVQIGPGRDGGAPRIGDNCYIGPGAKIFGNITLGNNIRIGANAVVNKTFSDDNILLVGIPAKAVPLNILEG